MTDIRLHEAEELLREVVSEDSGLYVTESIRAFLAQLQDSARPDARSGREASVRDEVSVAEARDALARFCNSHFYPNSRGGEHEHARMSIPADPRRDDDLRLSAFIKQYGSIRTQLAKALDERNLALKEMVGLSRELGLAQGKLAASEAAGLIDDWREKCERLERERDTAIREIGRLVKELGAAQHERDAAVADAESWRRDSERLKAELAEARGGQLMAYRELQDIIGLVNDDGGPPDDEFALGDARDAVREIILDLRYSRYQWAEYRKERDTLAAKVDELAKERDELLAWGRRTLGAIKDELGVAKEYGLRKDITFFSELLSSAPPAVKAMGEDES